MNGMIRYFDRNVDLKELPSAFPDPFLAEVHSLCKEASQLLQSDIISRKWDHNFGLDQTDQENVIGKMFGVLIVKDQQEGMGYLAGFSGKLAASNHHEGFVPPVYDVLHEQGFLHAGMLRLAGINERIADLESKPSEDTRQKIEMLRKERKTRSRELQDRISDEYHFLNGHGEKKSLRKIFLEYGDRIAPGGAGECAAPKLLQFAFEHQLKPVALAEFYWGRSVHSDHWQHRQFYPPCRSKCRPILSYMLEGLV